MNVAHIDELDAIELSDGFVWRPVRRHFGIQAFGVNAYTPGASGRVIEEHAERLGQEEIYVVLRGRVKFTVGGDDHELGQGQLLYVRDPSLRRGAVALSDEAAVLAVGGKPGEAFEVSAWETMFAAAPLVREERWDEAIELHEDALAERPNSAPLLYNLACFESRAGRGDDALRHLQRAVELEPTWVAEAAEDPDFDAIRSLEGFPAA